MLWSLDNNEDINAGEENPPPVVAVTADVLPTLSDTGTFDEFTKVFTIPLDYTNATGSWAPNASDSVVSPIAYTITWISHGGATQVVTYSGQPQASPEYPGTLIKMLTINFPFLENIMSVTIDIPDIPIYNYDTVANWQQTFTFGTDWVLVDVVHNITTTDPDVTLIFQGVDGTSGNYLYAWSSGGTRIAYDSLNSTWKDWSIGTGPDSVGIATTHIGGLVHHIYFYQDNAILLEFANPATYPIEVDTHVPHVDQANATAEQPTAISIPSHIYFDTGSWKGSYHFEHAPLSSSPDETTYVLYYTPPGNNGNIVSTDHSISYIISTQIWADKGPAQPVYVTQNANIVTGGPDADEIYFTFIDPFYIA